MSLLDVNVWLALVLSKHVHHGVASDWLAQVDEPGTVVLCRSVQLSLLRLLTTAAVLAPYGNASLTNKEAWSICQELASDDRVLPGYPEPPGIEGHWRSFAAHDRASPKLWMDAYLAAFTLASGCQLVTTDAAFRQFGGLDVVVLEQTGAK